MTIWETISLAFLVIGGNDIPRGVPGAGRSQTLLIRPHVLLPESPLLDVRRGEFPILFSLIDAMKEPFPLLLSGEMQINLNDVGSIVMEVSLQIEDGAKPFRPDGLVIHIHLWESFAAENLRMHANDQHLLIIRPIGDADPPAFWEVTICAPQKIVLQFAVAGLFESEYLAALGVDTGHHVLDGPIFSGRVHPLEDQQHSKAVGGIEKLLQHAQLCNMLRLKLAIVLHRFVHRLHGCRPFPRLDLVALPDAKIV